MTDYAIYMLDPDGLVSSWNPGAQRFKGYTADEIIGEHFSRFYTDEDREAGLPARALETAAREGKFEAEGWRVRKDGSRSGRTWSSIRSAAPPAKLVGFAKITRDLTERKEAQRAARADARGVAPVAEDGGDRPAHRRRRARLQQPADGGARQPRTDAQAPAATIRKLLALLENAVRRRAARRDADQAHARLRAAAGAEARGRSISRSWCAA